MTPDSWDLADIFSFVVAYGLYLTASTSVLLFFLSSPLLTYLLFLAWRVSCLAISSHGMSLYGSYLSFCIVQLVTSVVVAWIGIMWV